MIAEPAMIAVRPAPSPAPPVPAPAPGAPEPPRPPGPVRRPDPLDVRLVGPVAADYPRACPGRPDRPPDVRVWATRLAQAVAEVVAGYRPIAQLARWTDPAVYDDLNRRVRVLGLVTPATRAAGERAVVRSVHVCSPKPEVAEVAAHLRSGTRSRAVALRLEVRRGRWLCTALRLG